MLTKKQILAALLFGCIAIPVSLIVLYWASLFQAQRTYERLIAGDQTVRLSSVVVKGHGKRIVLNDPASLDYLATAMRSTGGLRAEPRFGLTYIATLEFVSGGSVEIGMYFPSEGNGITISSVDDLGLGTDPYYYWLDLPGPLPNQVNDMIIKLK
jgi:hypothetical protein